MKNYPKSVKCIFMNYVDNSNKEIQVRKCIFVFKPTLKWKVRCHPGTMLMHRAHLFSEITSLSMKRK